MGDTAYYDAARHGLPHDPLKAIVAPRPIGWISTYAEDGTPNLAPYSFFNLVSDDPKIVMFASTGWKDSATNARRRGAFAANFAGYGDRHAVSLSSATLPASRSEFAEIGREPIACRTIDAPMLGGLPAVLECVVTETVIPRRMDGEPAAAVIVFGQVVGYHLDPRFLRKGRFDTADAKPLARLGYRDYAAIGETFEIERPDDAK